MIKPRFAPRSIGAGDDFLVRNDGGIRVLQPDYQQTAVALLNTTQYSPEDQVFEGSDQKLAYSHGKAAIVLGSKSQGWVTVGVQNGFATLAKLDTIAGLGYGGSAEVIVTRRPQDIRDHAGLGGAYVVVDAPYGLLAAARLGLLPQALPSMPSGPIPFPDIVGSGGGGTTQYVNSPSGEGGLPGWVPLVALGGLMAAAAVIMIRDEQKHDARFR